MRKDLLQLTISCLDGNELDRNELYNLHGTVAARGIFRWGGKSLKNWVWSKIA